MSHPHAGQPILRSGRDLEEAEFAVILIHGRGAGARDILSLGPELDLPEAAFFAPQAARSTWYPQSFLAPIEANQPWLDSALRRLDEVVEEIGLARERIALVGFSQGACLALEYAARHSARWRGVIAFSGGLIGPPATPRDYVGNFAGTPIFIGCSDRDPHVPLWRVQESTGVLRGLGAMVEERIYPNLPHTIHPDELLIAHKLLTSGIGG